MSDDWQGGDLAECLTENWDYDWSYNPRVGDILRVSVVGLHLGELALGFESKPQRHGWEASAFRKIRSDAEPCEAEFTALIKRGARKPVRV